MKTPEDEMSFVVWSSLDVHAANAACCIAVVTVAWMGLRQLLHAFRRLLGVCKGQFSRTDSAGKQKFM
jgi:hypothetical protein